MKPISNREADALYRHLLAAPDVPATMMLLLLETGARVTEALSLGAANFYDDTSLTIPPLKGSRPRLVLISEALSYRLSLLPPKVWAAALDSTDRPASIKSRRRALCRHFHKLTRKILNRTVNLHALRHLAFSRLYTQTKDLLLVKEWAGHTSILSTMVYMREQSQREASEANLKILKKSSESVD